MKFTLLETNNLFRFPLFRGFAVGKFGLTFGVGQTLGVNFSSWKNQHGGGRVVEFGVWFVSVSVAVGRDLL